MIDICLDCKNFVHSSRRVVGKREEIKKEPISEDLERCVVEQMEADGDVDDFVRRGIDDIASKYAQLGAQWDREQMMKDAIDAVVAEGSPMPFQESIPVLTNTDMTLLPKDKFSIGDKVKVIIIKE